MKQYSILSILIVLGMFSCKSDIASQNKLKDIETQFKTEKGILVDVRSLEEWNSGHHTKAIHLDWNGGEFENKTKSWDPEKSYFLHCSVGGRSSKATNYLKSKGFKKVYNIGGYDDIKNLKLE